jgi:hypothetical protein
MLTLSRQSMKNSQTFFPISQVRLKFLDHYIIKINLKNINFQKYLAKKTIEAQDSFVKNWKTMYLVDLIPLR